MCGLQLPFLHHCLLPPFAKRGQVRLPPLLQTHRRAAPICVGVKKRKRERGDTTCCKKRISVQLSSSPSFLRPSLFCTLSRFPLSMSSIRSTAAIKRGGGDADPPQPHPLSGNREKETTKRSWPQKVASFIMPLLPDRAAVSAAYAPHSLHRLRLCAMCFKSLRPQNQQKKRRHRPKTCLLLPLSPSLALPRPPSPSLSPSPATACQAHAFAPGSRLCAPPRHLPIQDAFFQKAPPRGEACGRLSFPSSAPCPPSPSRRLCCSSRSSTTWQPWNRGRRHRAHGCAFGGASRFQLPRLLLHTSHVERPTTLSKLHSWTCSVQRQFLARLVPPGSG